ncbi:hypothetical protein Bca4012_005813 [Brassica carinata]|uniref:BnaCnng24530D protein n=3 Tax=Brassica TaxID=3705 RepID=A0A078IW29_BRANA|nr:hypothetical protein HID58_055194 [Brassica napus]CAF1707803.1 unnamed protein product [Brassica napus]CDY53153.1 BnaCnng24530D [Brassica napus]VDC95895.1 unnamed protein product [Brassica oleracea]
MNVQAHMSGQQRSGQSPNQGNNGNSQIASARTDYCLSFLLLLKTFFFVELDPQWAGICNGMAAGVMLAASFDLVNMLCITGCICDEV